MLLKSAPTVQNAFESVTGFAMFFVYSVLYSISLILLLPYFLLNRGKYLSGFKQRLGYLPQFVSNGRPVIWVHCVSVGETNAARPLIDEIRSKYPNYLVVVSTTTKTGYELAQKSFQGAAALVFYMPFDLRFIVRRVMRHIKPNIILIMETELWFNFLRSANRNKARVVVVNGRLSEKSLNRYLRIKGLMKRVLRYLDLALVQTEDDANRLLKLGINKKKVKVTGNFKYDQQVQEDEKTLTAYFRERFGFDQGTPLIVAASTHDPEETWILEAFKKIYLSGIPNLPRLVLVPRHPERFNEVEEQIKRTGLSYVRRTSPLSLEDDLADVVLLDSIGELRSIYPLADIVFVGGSLIPHGGQSIFEPALAKKTIVTGNFMMNFEAAAREFAERGALVRLPKLKENAVSEKLATQFRELLENPELKNRLAKNAFAVMNKNRGATVRTLKYLKPFLQVSGNVLRK